jgi:uncharacterized repeat protein (TIGR01451 family)
MDHRIDAMGGQALLATRLFQAVRERCMRLTDGFGKTGPMSDWTLRRTLMGLASIFLFAIGDPAQAATAPGTEITNTASAEFNILGGALVVRTSNTTTDTVVAPPIGATPASVQFVRLTETEAGEAATLVAGTCASSGGAVLLALPNLPSGAAIPGSGAVTFVDTSVQSPDFTNFVLVDDQDENTDDLLVETVQITLTSTLTGDAETITLTETGADTGRFLGYLPTDTGTATPGDCVLSSQIGDVIVGSYTDDDDGTDTAQDTVDTVMRTPAVIEFLTFDPTGASPDSTVGPTACANGNDLNDFIPMADPTSGRAGGAIDANSPVSLGHADAYKAGDPVFISVSDADHNGDPLALDTVIVVLTTDDPVDQETIQLTETGLDTGVFVGYIQSTSAPAVAGDCQISVIDGTQITATYTDDQDGTDTAVGAVLVDPFGVVFDAVTGAPVDGAIVTIVDAATGIPAPVFGDDGVSSYPNQITSGGDATDSSNVFYDFATGNYRFPFLNPGTYRLEVTPPAGYIFPSEIAEASIQILPGAPYAIVTGSRGEDFLLPIGPALQIDIPLDPVAAELFVQKTTTSSVAAVGDFVQYQVTIQNGESQVAPGTVVADFLPVGFRYMQSSSRLDGVIFDDPSIAADGRSLTWLVGDVAAGQTLTLTYVVEVGAGTRPGMSVNAVTAVSDGGQISNEATAAIAIREDLFQTRGFLVGHVSIGSCDADVSNDLDGVAGVRIYLEDGRYVVTDERGLYHFEGLRAGTHVVQLDLDSLPENLEILPCEQNTRFAGRAFSQFVDLQQGALWRADFYLAERPDQTGAVDLTLTGDLDDAAAAERGGDQGFETDLHLAGGPLPISNLSVTVLVPEGLELDDGSIRLDGEPLGEGVLQVMGPARVLRLGQRDGDWSADLTARGSVAAGASGELRIKAAVSFKDASGAAHRTDMVELPIVVSGSAGETREMSVIARFGFASVDLTETDLAALAAIADDVREQGLEVSSVEVIGHTDDVPVVRPRPEYSDNYELSEARALAVARALGELLQLPPSAINSRGMGPDQPLVEGRSREARAQNRRVEMRLRGAPVGAVSAEIDATPSSSRADFSVGHQSAPQATEIEAGEEPSVRAPALDVDRLARLQPSDGFVFPAMDANPLSPTSHVQFAHAQGETVRLYNNGEPVPAILYDGTTAPADGHVVVTSWRAVRLTEGDNLLRAEVLNADGEVLRSVEQVLHFGGIAVRAEYLPSRSTLVADGRTVPVIAVQLYDRWGAPARPGMNGDVVVEPPYVSRVLAERARAQNVLASESRGATYDVSPEGIAFIELEPTTQTGEAVVHLSLGQDRRDFEVRGRLQAGQRDWILVGLAEGTVGYNSVSGDLQALSDSDLAEDYYDEGRVAFFAKGTISGETLLTVSYDSDRAGTDDMSRLFGIVDPDEYYVIYGDGAQQRFDAASAEKLYIRVDRGTFYAMFGDFSTGLTTTELSRFSRRFTGVRSEYGGEVFSYNAFAAESDLSFTRDEIAGDGTSGLYRLTRSPLVINSERVIIETRDRFQGDVVLSRDVLQRHLDYNIDYLEGTLFFKRPIPVRDQDFNPVFIVVEYEIEGTGQGDVVAGGRAEVNLADGAVRLGATLVSDSSDQVDGNLSGLDIRIQANETTEIRAEIAQSQADNNGAATSGNGYRAELIHNGETVQGRIYTIDVDSGFGLGQQNVSGTGTTTTGVEGRIHIGEDWLIEGEAYTQDLEISGGQREVLEVGARYQTDEYGATVGLRNAQDRDAAGIERGSEQLYAGGSVRLLDGSLNLRANTEASLASSASSTDFPNRTTLGADYAITSSTDLFLEQEWADGAKFNSQNTRFGLRLRPWQGGEIASTVNRQFSERGARVFANLGLTQRWQQGEFWTYDFGLDRAQTLRQAGFTVFDPSAPLASGTSGTLTDDYTALTFGANYRRDEWQVNNRFEWRDGERSDKWGIFSGFYREAEPGRGFTASLSLFETSQIGGDNTLFADIRLGAAYRPVDTQWTVFDRLDLIYDSSNGALGDRTTYRIVNNLHANYMLNRQTQIMFQYGLKFVQANFDDFSVNGFTDLWGFAMIRDLGERWDIGFNAQSLNSWNAGTHDFRLGGSVGYNVADNVWLSVGYNVVGFVDTDFSAGDYTARGPFITFRFKFDQQSLRDLAQGTGYALPSSSSSSTSGN